MDWTLPELVNAQKRLAIAPRWQQIGASRSEMSSALLIDGVAIEGLEVRAKALLDKPERGVTFNLLFHPANSRCIQLIRIEWNPLRSHTNPLSGIPEIAGMLIKGTHIHHFEDNWLHDNACMRERNLPFARPVDLNPASFADLLVLVSDTLRVDGITSLEAPSWREGSLFGG